MHPCPTRSFLARVLSLFSLFSSAELLQAAAASAGLDGTLKESEVMLASGPQLGGDPQVDFVRTVDESEGFTVYLLSEALLVAVEGYAFGLSISAAAEIDLLRPHAPAIASVEIRLLGADYAPEQAPRYEICGGRAAPSTSRRCRHWSSYRRAERCRSRAPRGAL